MADELRPRREVRRFDVFAEYNRLKALSEGRPPDEAKSYGLWLAKVVASRRYGVSPPPRAHEAKASEGEEEAERTKEKRRFHSLGDEVQTEEMFDQEIAARMGERFYTEVFAPAIAEHFERGDRYESIRDVIRKDWKPEVGSKK